MKQTRQTRRWNRKERIRKRLQGTPERPRLAVYRSSRHMYAQIIDDQSGQTLVFASTLEKGHEGGGANKAGAVVLGKRLVEKAKAAKVESVVFDRGGYLYHGCVKAFADAVREGGLNF